jgi:predicted transcriptional regulator
MLHAIFGLLLLPCVSVGGLDLNKEAGSLRRSTMAHTEKETVVLTAGGEVAAHGNGHSVWKNWEDTVECFPGAIATPTSVEQVRGSMTAMTAMTDVAKEYYQGVLSKCPTQAVIGEFECGCAFIHQVSSLVKGHKRVRAVGLGHSYNDFTCSDDLMINMTALNQVLSLNPFSMLDLKAHVDLYAANQSLTR